MSTFESRLKFRKEVGNGVFKMVTETYIVNALSFTEAEANITKEMGAYLNEPFKVVNIRPTNYVEVVANDRGDKWFKAKVALTVFDDESGKDKKQNIYILIQADDVKEAYGLCEVTMSTSLGDYKISAVSETLIVDVFKN
jgi:hypothetical protein